MDRWRGKVAIVTGASAGIGASICCKLVEEGLQVVGFARRVEKVEELSKTLGNYSGKLYAVKCDVSKKEDVIAAFKMVKDKFGPVHILVNNAGLYKHGTILEGNPDDWKTVLDTNVWGLAHCSKLVIQQMKENNINGHIINMNSVAGHTAIAGIPPILNIYSPSKFALTSLCEILRQEIKYFKYTAKIKVTSISPGLVDTEIFETAGTKIDMNKYGHLKTKDITDAVVYVLSTGPHVQIEELTIAPLDQTNLVLE